MRIKFEPSGTHIKNDKLKIRFDVYPDKGSKTYTEQYIDVFARELTEAESETVKTDKTDKFSGQYTDKALELQKQVPTKKQLNPFLCMFIEVDPNITPADIANYLTKNFDKNVLLEIDDAIADIADGIKLKTIIKDRNNANYKNIKAIESQKESIKNILTGFEIEVN